MVVLVLVFVVMVVVVMVVVVAVVVAVVVVVAGAGAVVADCTPGVSRDTSSARLRCACFVSSGPRARVPPAAASAHDAGRVVH